MLLYTHQSMHFCVHPGLEIATILAPSAFLTLGSVANMIKGLSWMAGGSTRSVFNLTFARDNNIAGERQQLAHKHMVEQY